MALTNLTSHWFIVEAKSFYKSGLSQSLYYYQAQLKVPHAFQVALDLPYVEQNCFNYNKPIIVPALTFLSQLI